MKLLEQAVNQLEALKQVDWKIRQQLKDDSGETLRLSKSNGTFQYYLEIKDKRTYIRKKNLQVARALAQRDYNKKLEHFIAKNIAILEQFTKNYAPETYVNCFSKLPAARRVLVKPIFLDDATFTKQWQAQKFEPNKDFPKGNLFTKKEEHVRSKSEVIIANLLNSNGVPYHYEAPVIINNSLTLHPDFFCLNKRTRQEFYWEHCGMMDDSEYSARLVHRLSQLAQKNIIPGKNLILTMETMEHPLNTKDVERVIKVFLE